MGTRLSVTERFGLHGQQVSGGLTWGTRTGEQGRVTDTGWGHPGAWIMRQVSGAQPKVLSAQAGEVALVTQGPEQSPKGPCGVQLRQGAGAGLGLNPSS